MLLHIVTQRRIWIQHTIMPSLLYIVESLGTFGGGAQSCLTLCNSMDCNPLVSSVHGIFQARIMEWVAISCSMRSSQPRDWTQVSCISGTGRPLCYLESPRKLKFTTFENFFFLIKTLGNIQIKFQSKRYK